MIAWPALDSADPRQPYGSYSPVHIATPSYDIPPPTYQHLYPSWSQQPVYSDPQHQGYYRDNQQAPEVYPADQIVRDAQGNPPVAQGPLGDYPHYPSHFNQAHSHRNSVINPPYSMVEPASSAVAPPTYFAPDSPFEEPCVVESTLYSQECDPQVPLTLRPASSEYFVQRSSRGSTYQPPPEGHGYSEQLATSYQPCPDEHAQHPDTQYPPALESVYAPQSMEQYHHYPDPQQHPSHHPLSTDTDISPHLQQPPLVQATAACPPQEEYYDNHHCHRFHSVASEYQTGSASYQPAPIEQQWSPPVYHSTPVSATGDAVYTHSSAPILYGVAVPNENTLPYMLSTSSSLACALTMPEIKHEDVYSSHQDAPSSHASGSRRNSYPGQELPQRCTIPHTVALLPMYPSAHSRAQVQRLEHQHSGHQHSQLQQQQPSQSPPSSQNRRLPHGDIKQEENLEPPPFQVRTSARAPAVSSSIAAMIATVPGVNALAAQLNVPLPPSDLDSPTSHEARVHRRKSSIAVTQHYNPYMKGKGRRDGQKDIKHHRASLDESGAAPSASSTSPSSSLSTSSATARTAKCRQAPSSRQFKNAPLQAISVPKGPSLTMQPFLPSAGPPGNSEGSVATSNATHLASFHSHESKAGGQHQTIKFSSPGVAEAAGNSKGGSGKSRNGEMVVDASGKKKRYLACGFCRQRKIACGAGPLEGANNYGIPEGPRTCNQCFRRDLDCEFPSESRRGLRKVYDDDGDDNEGEEEDDQIEGSSSQGGSSSNKCKRKDKAKATPAEMVPAVDDWWICQMRENRSRP